MRDHLFRWRNRDIHGTLARNYDRDVLIVTSQGVRLGASAALAMEHAFDACFPCIRIQVERVVVNESLAVATWRADGSDAGDGPSGVDSFFIRGGLIRLQVRELRGGPGAGGHSD